MQSRFRRMLAHWPTMTRLKLSLASLGFGLLAACAGGSGSGVPHLDPQRLVHVTLDSVQPRRLDVALTDERQPRPANSDTMLLQVGQAVRTIVTRAGIEVESGAPSHLAIRFTYPDSALRGNEPQDCIVMSAVIRLENGGGATSQATSCLTYKNLYGMRVSNDPSGVYEDVVNMTFKGLDGLLSPHPSP